MQNIKEIMIATFIMLIPIQDSALQLLPIGILGINPSFIPLLVIILIDFLEWIISDKKLRVNKILFYIISYVLIISLLYLLLTGLESHGRNLIFKTFNLSILTLLFMYPIFFIDYKKFRYINRYVQVAFIIAVIGVLLTDVFQTGFVQYPSLFHAHLNENWRPRGFSWEASYLSATIMSLGFLSAYFTKNNFLKFLTMLIAVVITIYSASKGGLVALFLIASFMIFFKTRMKSWMRLSIVFVLVLVFMMMYEQLETRFIGDMENTTSTATRTVLLTTSVITLMYNPFGVGFSGFLPAINKYTGIAIDFIGNVFNVPLKFIEVYAYIGADTDQSIGTKTFLFDYLAYFGIPFILLYLWFHKRLIGRLLKTDHNLLTAGVIFCLIVISTYIPGVGIYGISILYGVAFNEIYSK